MASETEDFGNFYPSQLKQSLGELLGIARGLLADQELSDAEIKFLDDWLDQRFEITSSFPGNVIHSRIKQVLEDDIITEEERSHLVATLTMLIEDRSEEEVRSRHGLGTEIEAAMKLRALGKPVKIIPEDSWVTQL